MKKRQKQSLAGDTSSPEPAWRRQKLPRKRSRLRANATLIARLQTASATHGFGSSNVAHGSSRGGGLSGRNLVRLLPAALSALRESIRLDWRRWALVPLAMVIACAAFELSTNDHFFVYAAQIQGNTRVSAQDIYAASGIDGKNIFWISPAEVVRRVSQMGGISQVAVHVRLPDQVTIQVQELMPLVIWKTARGTFWVTDGGQTMAPAGDPPALTLTDRDGTAGIQPADGAPGSDTAAGLSDSGVSPGPRLRSGVLAQLVALRTLRSDISNLYYGAEEGLYFRAPEGWTVYLGNEGDVASKLTLLQAVQKQAAGEKTPPRVVDLRLEGQAVYR